MDKETLLTSWRNFFIDLFVGTFKNLFLLSLAGFALGMATLALFQGIYLEDLEWSTWLKTFIWILALFWFGGLGVLHGLAASVVHTTGKKLSEMVGGLHDLLDLLTHEALRKVPRFGKNIPKAELARAYDNIGNDFREKLRLKKGTISFISGILFGMILKVLKFFFLDNVVEELSKKPSDQITPGDIENAVRRVGVELVLSPIMDNLFLLQILNGIIIALLFGIPFGIFLLF